jgi:metallo-beta-lactamase class B
MKSIDLSGTHNPINGCVWYQGRMLVRSLTLATLFFALVLTAPAQDKPEWSTPIAPFQLADNLYYVGSQDLASYLITTPKGNILINANLEVSPPQIRASVEKLGFRWADTRILLNGQAHFDHMAGADEVLRETHAQNMVMDGDVSVVESGGATDFLMPQGNVRRFPPAHVDRILHDGSTVTLGNVTLTAHKTAGHTRGCTTWTFRVHMPGDPAAKLRDVVIVGGFSFWSDFHFVDQPRHPASYPGIENDFRHTFAELRALPCDLFLGEHGKYFGLTEKLPLYAKIGPRAFLDPAGYRAFIREGEADFKAEVAKEKAQP